MPSAGPIFTVTSVERTCEFYQRVLGAGGPGAMPAGRWGKVIHGEVDLHGQKLAFTPDDGPPGSEALPYRQRGLASTGPRGAGMCIYVRLDDEDDLDGHCERIRAAGATVLIEPHDRPFGARLFAIEDPDGYVVTFTQRAGKGTKRAGKSTARVAT